MSVTIAIMLTMPLAGCHVLLLFPCLAMPCGTEVTSIPPRNDPFARALGESRDLAEVEAVLTSVAQTQYAALDQRWPAELQCDRVAAVGCRYSIPLRVTRHEGFRRDFVGCGLLDVAVVEGPAGRPEARRMRYQNMHCPELPLTPDGRGG